LYGRDAELRELLDLLIAERIVLLHSPSGAGKSSLVQAGLIPLLVDEGFEVLPLIRLNQELPTGLGKDGLVNRYTLSALLSLEASRPPEEQIPVEKLATLSLEEYLEGRPKPTRGDDDEQTEAQVLIFDQFEEVLTVDATDRESKLEFFAQAGAALRNRKRWALFAMREDYLAALDPYLRHIPTRLANTYRLDFLGVNAARQAIQQPVKESGVDFSAKAVSKLVNDLRQVQVQRPDGSMEIRLGPYVEPVQLQVVCYHLWQQIPADEMEISEEDLSTIGNVDQSLAEYYAQQVMAAASNAAVKERSIRYWFEHHLITEGGIRGQVLMGSGSSAGLANHAIFLLENSHLVRAEKRLGATWFELAHDRLIQPVRSNNAAWFQQHLSLLQRQATLWEQQNRADTLFLRDEALVEAEKWAAEHGDDLSQTDREFLAACQEQRAREEEARAAAERERQLKLEAAEQLAEAERRRAEEQAKAAGRLRRRAYILAGVLALAVLMAVLAFFAWQQAQVNARNANIQRSTAQAASTLAFENAATAQAAGQLAIDNEATAQANAVIAQAASTAAVAQQITAEYNAEVARQQEQIARTQANLARSRELASLALTFLKDNSDLTLLLSNEALTTANTGQALDALLKGLQRNLSRKAEKYDQFIPRQEIDVYALAASPDGTRLAWGGTDGLIRAWDLQEQEVAWSNFVPLGATVNAMTFIPNGDHLITGDTNGTLAFWDSESGQRVRTLPTELDEIYSMALSPDGTTLAFGGKSQGREPNIFTRNLQDNTVRSFRIRQGEVADVLTLAWSPDGKLLASGGRDRVVHIWDPETSEELETLKNMLVNNAPTDLFEGPVRSIAFSPNGKWLATGGDDNQGGVRDKTLQVWDTSAWTDQPPIIFGSPDQNLTALAFSPDGNTLVSAYENGETRVWNFNSQEAVETLQNHNREVVGLGFSQFEDALLLVSAGLDREIVMSNLIAPLALSAPLAEGKGNPTRLAANSENTLRVAGGVEGNVTLWDIDAVSGDESQADPGISSPEGWFYLSQDGNKIAFITADNLIEVRDLDIVSIFTISVPAAKVETVDAAGQSTISEQPAQIDSLAFNPDGSSLAGGMCSERKLTTDPETSEQSDTCLQNAILIWEIASGELLQQLLTDQTSPVLSLAFNPTDSTSLAAGYGDGSIQFWDLEQERSIGNPLLGAGGPVASLAFHQDGDILASGSENNLVALWNLNPPQLIGDPLSGADSSVTGLAFSPDTSQLYSGSSSGTILLWNLALWKETGCNLAQRNFTQNEWEQFFPAEEYHLTCEGAPTPTPSPTIMPVTPSPTGEATATPTP
jgi:WD40 repeat protein